MLMSLSSSHRERLAALLFGLFLSVCLVEIGGRAAGLLPVEPPESFYRLRTAAGLIPEPYETITHRFDNNLPNVVRFNYRSFRDIDHTYDKPDDVQRVLILGDSFSAAWEVPLEKSYIGVWRSWLKDTPYEIINAAFPGWSTDRELLLYRVEGRTYHPDIVLLQVYIGNDLIDNGLSALQNRVSDESYSVSPRPIPETAPYFTLDKAGLLTYNPPKAVVLTSTERKNGVTNWLLRNSVTYRVFDSFIKRLSTQNNQPQPSPLRPSNILSLEYDAFSPAFDQDADWKTAKTITRDLLEQLHDEVKADEAQLVVLLIDPIWQMDPTRWQTIQDTYQFPDTWHKTRMSDWWRSTLNDLNIPVIDTLPPLLTDAAQTGSPILFPYDGHWTPKGHCFIALSIGEWMHREENWPAPSDTASFESCDDS